MKKPLVSILVSTRNSEIYFRRCLESVKKQTYKNWELIVVDNFSTDHTIDIAKGYTKKIYKKGPERSNQYNFGAKKARGKYIYRTDSDFLIGKKVVEECVRKCEEDNIDGIAVHNTSDDSLGFWSRARRLERDCYIDDESVVGVRFMKRSVFNKLGGFDERMFAGEDYDLHNRFVDAGYKWGRIKAYEIHMGEVTSIVDFARQSFRYGRNLVFYVDKHPGVAKKQMVLVRPAFIRHKDKLLKSPFLTTGMFFMNFVKFVSGSIGYLYGKVEQKNHK